MFFWGEKKTAIAWHRASDRLRSPHLKTLEAEAFLGEDGSDVLLKLERLGGEGPLDGRTDFLVLEKGGALLRSKEKTRSIIPK